MYKVGVTATTIGLISLFFALLGMFDILLMTSGTIFVLGMVSTLFLYTGVVLCFLSHDPYIN